MRLETSQPFEMSLNFDTFCGHAARGQLADVQRMLKSGKLRGNGNAHRALVRAAENGHVDVVDCLLRHAMFDPSADGNRAIQLAAENGHLAVCKTSASTRRPTTTSPSDGLLFSATSRSSSDC
jgi:hypothetical protein